MRNYKGTYNGNTLAHYRTKGSRNGYSKDPNYTPIGEKAKGLDYNNTMNAARTYDTVQRAARQPLLGPRAMSNSYNQAAYQRAQARAIQDRNKAYGTAYGQMRSYGNAQAKANAAQRQAGINSAKNVGTNLSHPTGKPNKGNYGAPTQQQLVEQRRIAGGRGVMLKDPELARKRAEENAIQARIAGGSGRTAQAETTARMIKGSAMTKTPEQRQTEVMARRIKGGNYGSTARKGAGINSGYEAQAAEKAKQNQRAEYAKLERRRKYENLANGITANKMAAEARRIAGSKLGSKYEDKGEGNFRRGASLAKQAFKEAAHKRYYYDYGRGHSSSDRAADHAKLAVKEIATGTAKTAKSLVKKGRKKVKTLMKRFFG